MISIKKVQVVPLDINYGKIIDSFNTTDNKQTNAPSINAVEQYVGDTIEQFFDDRITVIRTTLTLPANETVATAFIDLPTGYTNANTVILSTMISQTDDYYVNDLATNLITKISTDYFVPRVSASIGSLLYVEGEGKLTLVHTSPSAETTARTFYITTTLLKTS